MTVTELIQRLVELENEGGGDSEVWLSADPHKEAPRTKANTADFAVMTDDNIVIINSTLTQEATHAQ